MAWLIALGMCALCVHLFYFDKRFFAKLWRVLSTSANPFLPKKRSVESPDSENRRTDAEKTYTKTSV